MMKKKILVIMAIWLYGLMVLLSPSLTWAQCDMTGGPEGCLSPGEIESTRRAKEFLNALKAGEEGQSNKEWFDNKTVENLLQTINVAVGGVPVEVPAVEGAKTKSYRYEGGAISVLANLTGTLYQVQPASSVEYLADLGGSFGLVPPAYAQGMGWQAFSPVLSLWKTFRNIAYLAFIVIFVVIGFMIMFRRKIDPQTVISVQNALPRIIVTLILITFSYAIAGLIIDLGQLTTRIVGNAFGVNGYIAQGISGLDQTKLNNLLGADVFRLVNPLRDASKIAGRLADLKVGPTEFLPDWLANITVTTIFLIAGFFIMFKIFFALIGPYVTIIVSIIFAPFQLLLGAVPGSQGGLGSWLRNLVANVLVFPVTFAMLAIAAVFKGYTRPAIFLGPSADWSLSPTDYTISWAPAALGQWGDAAGQLVAFGILFMIPQVVTMVKQSLSVKESPWAGAAGAEIKGAMPRIPIIGNFLGSFVK